MHHLWFQCTSQFKVQIPPVRDFWFWMSSTQISAMNKRFLQKIGGIRPKNRGSRNYKHQVRAKRTMWRFHWLNLHFVYITLVNHRQISDIIVMTKKWANSSSVDFPQWKTREKKQPSLRTLGAQCARPQTPRFLRFAINKAFSTLQGSYPTSPKCNLPVKPNSDNLLATCVVEFFYKRPPFYVSGLLAPTSSVSHR